jgi:hypothetical protein
METKIKHRKWKLQIEKPRGMRMYWTWSAESSKGDYLADDEGGDLGSMSNAKQTIKSWIKKFEKNPIAFKQLHPFLHVDIGD